MSLETTATIEDLYRVPENGKAELVNGELIIMAATGFLPGFAGGEIYSRLREYGFATRRGYGLPDNVGYIINLPARQSVSVWWESAKGWQELVTDLPKRQSFSPDAAFFTGRLPRQPGKFLEGAPILTVEVRSENDYGETAEKEIAKKRVDYFEAGTLVVWAVDVLREQLINSSVRTSRFSRQCIAGGGMPKQNRLCQIGAWQSSSCFHRFGNKLANVP